MASAVGRRTAASLETSTGVNRSRALTGHGRSARVLTLLGLLAGGACQGSASEQAPEVAPTATTGAGPKTANDTPTTDPQAAPAEPADAADGAREGQAAPGAPLRPPMAPPAAHCSAMCDRAVALDCGAHAPCLKACEEMSAKAPCPRDMARFMECALRYDNTHWQCTNTNVAAIKKGEVCAAEQAEFLACAQRLLGRIEAPGPNVPLAQPPSQGH